MKDDRFELVETYKVNGKVYGYVTKSRATDELYYFARRRHADIYRSREKSISDAMSKGIACWAIDDLTLKEMLRRGVKHVGVWLRDFGDTYVAPIEAYFDRGNAVIDYTARGGAYQRLLPLSRFEHTRGRVFV